MSVSHAQHADVTRDVVDRGGIEAVELDGFGRQNVLDDLVLDDPASGSATGASISVTLPSDNGLDGTFRCESVIVLSATPFEPGPFSIYYLYG